MFKCLSYPQTMAVSDSYLFKKKWSGLKSLSYATNEEQGSFQLLVTET